LNSNTSKERQSQALAQLQRTAADPELATAMLEAIEDKRAKDCFIRYWQPFDYQRPVFEAFDADTKILVVCGGNRSGKTEVGAALTTAWAEGKEYFRGEKAWSWVANLPIPVKTAKNIWIVGLDFNVLRDVIWREKLFTGANHPGFIPKDATVANVREADKQIFLSNNAVITGKSADSGREKFQSASVDLAWIDEECDAEIFDETYQRTIDCGGKIIVTVTPLTDISSAANQPWIFDLKEQMMAGRKDIKFVYLNVLDNPIISQDEKTKLLAKWAGHPEERARIYGEFVRRSGLVYPMWDKKVHIKRIGQPPRDWMRVCSIDPAATGTTAALWGAIDPAGNIHLFKEYYEKDLVVSDHVKNIEIRQGNDLCDLWLIDPQWGQQRNAETHKTGQQLYRNAGLPVRLAEVGEDYGLNSSREYLQATVDPHSRHPKVWVDPSLGHFIDEIEHYVYDNFKQGPLKGLTKEKPIKRNDHLMNAFQYMCAMKPRPRQRLQKVFSEEELRAKANSNSYF
jgi:phage terminase large subunit-like protein